MDCVFVAHWLLVEALVLPHGVVLPASRGVLRIVDRAFGVLAGRPHVDLLDPAWGLARRPLSAVHHDKGDEARYEGQDDQAYHDPDPVRTSTVRRPHPASSLTAPALAHLITSLFILRIRHAKGRVPKPWLPPCACL